MSAEFRDLADRVRSERKAARFSQAEFAAEVGCTKAALDNFESCQAPLSFRVGWQICRRLDISPRWLATGASPKRPFVEVDELGLPPTALSQHVRRGVDFIAGYNLAIRSAAEKWYRQNPPEQILQRSLEGSRLETLARRFSNTELVEHLQSMIDGLKQQGGDNQAREVYVRNLGVLMKEVAARFSLRE